VAVTVRVMKARRPGRLACGHWVPLGHLIARQGQDWVCVECAITAIRAANDHPASQGGAAKEGTT
jgi:hypothetical protein